MGKLPEVSGQLLGVKCWVLVLPDVLDSVSSSHSKLALLLLRIPFDSPLYHSESVHAVISCLQIRTPSAGAERLIVALGPKRMLHLSRPDDVRRERRTRTTRRQQL